MINNIMFYSFIVFILAIILFFVFPFIYISYEKLFYGKHEVKDRIDIMSRMIEKGTKVCTFLILVSLITFITSLPFKWYYNYKDNKERKIEECKNVIKIIKDKNINVYSFYVPISNYEVKNIIKNSDYKLMKSDFVTSDTSCIFLFTKKLFSNLTDNSIEISKNFIIKPIIINKIENEKYLEKIFYHSFKDDELMKFKEALKNE